MTEEHTPASILVVDDEQSVADGYALRLGTQYDRVETAYGGPETLEVLADTAFDVLLLDRRMPEMTGDDVLDAVRERGHDCRVIMVTAVAPDFDIVDMPFDDYLHKPIEKENLFAAIEQQLHAERFDSELESYFATSSKLAVLEADKSAAQLADNNRYQRLKAEAEALEADLDDRLDAFDDVVSTFSSIDRT